MRMARFRAKYSLSSLIEAMKLRLRRLLRFGLLPFLILLSCCCRLGMALIDEVDTDRHADTGDDDP